MLLGMGQLGGAGPDALRLGGQQTLSDAGVRFREIREMTGVVQKPPRAAERQGRRFFFIADAWRFCQRSGEWRFPGGTLAAFRMQIVPPQVDGNAVAEAQADQLLAPAPERLQSVEAQLKWLRYCCGETAGITRLEPLPPEFGRRLTRVETADASPFFIWLIAPANAPARRIALILRRESGGPEEFRKLAEQLARSCTFFAPQPEKRHPVGSAQGRAAGSIRNLKGWWQSRSANYLFVSNQRNRNFPARVQRELEQARKLFPKFLQGDGAVGEPGLVRIFATRREYLDYAGTGMEYSGGYWSPQHLELVISPLEDRASDEMQNMVLRQTVLHEGFHQFLYHAARGAASSMWFNEGMAGFFERMLVKGNAYRLQLRPGEEREVLNALRRTTLERLTALDYEEFYADLGRDANYRAALGVTYYCLWGAPASGHPEYAAIPVRYYRELAATRDLHLADERAFAGVDKSKFWNDLLQFWSSPALLKRAARRVGS